MSTLVNASPSYPQHTRDFLLYPSLYAVSLLVSLRPVHYVDWGGWIVHQDWREPVDIILQDVYHHSIRYPLTPDFFLLIYYHSTVTLSHIHATSSCSLFVFLHLLLSLCSSFSLLVLYFKSLLIIILKDKNSLYVVNNSEN